MEKWHETSYERYDCIDWDLNKHPEMQLLYLMSCMPYDIVAAERDVHLEVTKQKGSWPSC